MTRELALLVIVAVAALLVGTGVWAWRRRVRRDGGLTAPVGEAPADADVIAQFAGFYVATTRHDEPLERLAIRGLAFRSRVEAVITTAGIALELPGQQRLFVPASAIVAADQATVAIDRVVEKGGLARVSWRIDTQTVVDSYFRPQDTSTRGVVDAVATLIPAQTPNTPTGSDA
jgi:hypothetical protein